MRPITPLGDPVVQDVDHLTERRDERVDRLQTVWPRLVSRSQAEIEIGIAIPGASRHGAGQLQELPSRVRSHAGQRPPKQQDLGAQRLRQRVEPVINGPRR